MTSGWGRSHGGMEMAAHSIIFAWKVPWTEEPGVLQSTGSQRIGMTEWLSMHAVSGISKKISNKIEFFEKGEKRWKQLWHLETNYAHISSVVELQKGVIFLEIKTVQWTVPDVHRRGGGRKLM